MNSFSPRTRAVFCVLLVAALGASCGATVRESADTRLASPRGYTEADVRFMQGMIHHHDQALVMTSLVPDRAESEGLRRLALRIEISQRDEIARMRRWLEARGEEVPGEHMHGPLMPGMLTEDEMARLAGAAGAEFDRLFLELMIRHHEGALVMVEDLLSHEGAGQEAEIFQFISNVDADQRAEIARMRGLLSPTPQGGRR